MDLVILDGTYGSQYDAVRHKIVSKYESLGANIEIVKLEDQNIGYCTGCLSCWFKTPGHCIHKDDTHDILRKVINSDLVIHLTENTLGFSTSMTKKMIDKFVALMHPYIVIDQEECHHRKRYETYPKQGLVFIDNNKNIEDFKTTEKIFERSALNFKTTLAVSIHTTIKGEGI